MCYHPQVQISYTHLKFAKREECLETTCTYLLIQHHLVLFISMSLDLPSTQNWAFITGRRKNSVDGRMTWVLHSFTSGTMKASLRVIPEPWTLLAAITPALLNHALSFVKMVRTDDFWWDFETIWSFKRRLKRSGFFWEIWETEQEERA